MVSRTFFFLFLIILTVKSENNTLGNVMKKIVSEYSNSTSTCNNYAPWFFEQMIKLLNCGPLPKLNNSRIQYTLKWEEEKIHLQQKCNRNFEASVENTADIICWNGKWMYEDKKCKLITCPIFHKPAHSFMTNVAYTYNSVIHFSCVSDYILRGNNSIRCQENQQWSSLPPACEIVKCLLLHPPKHGNINNTNEVKVNETVSFTCLKPYNLKGESVLTCLRDGSWNFPTPVCTLKCVVPEIAGRVVTISEGTILKPRTLINQGGKVLYSCKRSFMPVAFGVVQCLSGKWYPDIKCRKTCKIEKLHGLNFILSHNFSVIEYSCSAGETLLGDSKRTCLENGTWSGKLPQCVKNCQLLPEFGIYGYRNSDTLKYLPFGSTVTENTNVTYSCQLPYVNNTNDNVICQNGVLTPKPRCSYADIRLIDSKVIFTHESSNHFVCETNYTCEFFGYRQISCEWVNCGFRSRFHCVNVGFNNVTSEIYAGSLVTHCCVLQCND
ncbi:sushi, von Willebrand factor type A, EGF and pentraxin domain-containing protein 1 [Octopus bimaculoides]|nr:sushi, von Willebrand factor type A, EGF and pentraxin domain-containing protein 1 [Octopus bimaculoides]|eukprot:XP_014781787.1 PREDICTED: sushi, von Willebrand factor type A, EGF and pentraxin domain-containing protein 1-like [Octopus bimaculoides]